MKNIETVYTFDIIALPNVNEWSIAVPVARARRARARARGRRDRMAYGRVLRKLTVCRHWTLDRLPARGSERRVSLVTDSSQSRNGVSGRRLCVRLVSTEPERTPAQNIGLSIRVRITRIYFL